MAYGFVGDALHQFISWCSQKLYNLSDVVRVLSHIKENNAALQGTGMENNYDSGIHQLLGHFGTIIIIIMA